MSKYDSPQKVKLMLTVRRTANGTLSCSPECLF